MKYLKTILSFILTAAVPFLIIMNAAWVLTVFYHVEYRLPYFPADPYGFTRDERIEGARLSIEYLLNSEGLEYFDQYKLSDGSPFYNQDELSHMQDVKLLIQTLIKAWIVTWLFVLVIYFIFRKLDLPSLFWKAAQRGNVFSIVILAAVIIFIAIGFSTFFTNFHQVFFPQGNWMFEYSDTFIRLFPMQFWQDAFIWVVVLAFLQSLLLYRFTRRRLGK